MLGNYCTVGSSNALPSHTSIVGEGVKTAHVDRTTIVTVNTKDWHVRETRYSLAQKHELNSFFVTFQDNLTLGPEVEQFFCEIVPKSLNPSPAFKQAGRPIELTTELADLEDGSYELTYALPVHGEYELAVKMFDEHIQGSPFRVSFVLLT